jgi:hypothetical protein
MLTNNAYWNKDSGGAGVKFTNLSYKVRDILKCKIFYCNFIGATLHPAQLI